MAKKKKAVVEEGFALKNPSGEQAVSPPTQETAKTYPCGTPKPAYQILDRTGILPCESTPEETRPVNEALSDIVAKQTDILKNEPVPVTEIKPLSEKVLASLYEKHNVPRDFNASHPRWNVPSVKNRYALLLADIKVHEKM